jgi:hypothetical protein
MAVPSSEIIRIEPRDLITPPYDDCPACGARDQLGLITVGPTFYRKRCRVCMRDQSHELPTLAPKRVLYLDQLAISNLLKTTLKEHSHKFTEDRAATQSGYWPRLLDRLERLVHLNLLVCPRSSIHELEAAFDDRLSGHLRSFHEQLAANVQFEHQLTVERFQLEMSCVAWLNSREPESLGRGEVVRGRLDAWLDRFVVNAYYPVTPDEISRLRAERDRIDGGLQGSFVRWRDEGPREFDALFGEQVDAYGPGFVSHEYLSEMKIGLRARMESHGVPPAQWSEQMNAFLRSEAAKKTHFARIAAGMLGALAWRAGRNQLAPPTRGLRADLRAISTYLPYADAMFVDNECARLLKDVPLRDQLPYSTRIFSIDSRDELLDWLTEIEDQAPPGHLDLVEHVYGPSWLKPRRVHEKAPG